MEFGVERFSQSAGVTGGERRRARSSSLRSLVSVVVPPVVLCARASSPEYLAWGRRALACPETPGATERTQHWKNSLSTSGIWPDPRARETTELGRSPVHFWRLMSSEETCENLVT